MAEEPIRRQLQVINPQGMHARPAALLVKLANQFKCEIDLIKDNMRVDAKSILNLMTLAAEQGTILHMEARGVDAAAAADAIEKLFLGGLGDLDEPPSVPEQ